MLKAPILILIINIVFFCGLFLTTMYLTFSYVKKIKQISTAKAASFIYILLGLHLLAATFGYLITKSSRGDAVYYFESALRANSWTELIGTGSYFIKLIAYFFKSFGLNYFNVFFIFSLFGLVGFYKFYELILDYGKKENITFPKYFFLLLLFPTFHINTVAIGKDALILFLLATLFKQIFIYRGIKFKTLIPIIFIILVRPHVSIIFIVAYVLVLFFSSELSSLKKIGIVLVGIIGLMIAIPVIETRLKVSITDFDGFSSKLDRIQNFSNRKDMGSSTINIKDKSIAFRMFAYSYLPLIWKADSILKYLVSVENLYLLFYLFLLLLKKGKRKFIKNSNLMIKLMLVYSLIAWFIFSFSLYNLGLSTRQKYMYIPFLYFVIFAFLANIKTKVNVKTQTG